MKLKFRFLFSLMISISILLGFNFSAYAEKTCDFRQLRNRNVTASVKMCIDTKKFSKDCSMFFNQYGLKNFSFDIENMSFMIFDNKNRSNIMVPVISNKKDIVGSILVGVLLQNSNFEQNLNFLSQNTEGNEEHEFILDSPSFEFYPTPNPPAYQTLEALGLAENMKPSKVYLLTGYKGKFSRLVHETIDGSKHFYVCY